jgi:hypothetical protein
MPDLDLAKAMDTETQPLQWPDLFRIYPERRALYAEATRVYLQGHPPAFEVIAGAGRSTAQQPPLMAAVSP